jgi:hypothetical protein
MKRTIKLTQEQKTILDAKIKNFKTERKVKAIAYSRTITTQKKIEQIRNLLKNQ